MKKIICFFVITIMFVFSSAVFAVDVINIIVNNKKVVFDTMPFIETDSYSGAKIYMVPLRAICEGYGCFVEWDQYNKTATVYLDGAKKEFCLYTVGKAGVEGHEGDAQYVYVCCKPISIINNRIIVEMDSLPFTPIKDETDYSKNNIVFRNINSN